MANVVVSLRVMPEGVDTDLEILEEKVRGIIRSFIGNDEIRAEKKPLAFGLSSIDFIFSMAEEKNLENLENEIKLIYSIRGVNVLDVRRAIG